MAAFAGTPEMRVPASGATVLTVPLVAVASVVVYAADFSTPLPAALLLTVIGAIIFYQEYRAGLPVPVTPAFLFWAGHMAVFCIAGLDVYYNTRLMGVFRAHYPWQLSVICISLSAMYTSYALVTAMLFARAGRAKVRVWPRFEFKMAQAATVGAIIIITGILMAAVIDRLSGVVLSVVRTFVIGPVTAMRLPLIAVFGLYLMHRRKSWLAVLLFALAGTGQYFITVFYGGREAVTYVAAGGILITAAYLLRQGRLWRALPTYAGILLMGLIYFSVVADYRTSTGYGRFELTAGNRIDAFLVSLDKFLARQQTVAEDEKYSEVRGRFYEFASIRVMTAAKLRGAYWGAKGWIDLLFEPLPDFMYRTGENRANDILWKENLKRWFTSAESMTLVGDLYFRFALPGVVLGYMLYGMILGIAVFVLVVTPTSFRFILLVAYAMYNLRMYTPDFVAMVWSAPVFLAEFGAVNYVVFKFLRFPLWPRRQRAPAVPVPPKVDFGPPPQPLPQPST